MQSFKHIPSTINIFPNFTSWFFSYTVQYYCVFLDMNIGKTIILRHYGINPQYISKYRSVTI